LVDKASREIPREITSFNLIGCGWCIIFFISLGFFLLSSVFLPSVIFFLSL
jgi:hypothetical protein